MNVIQYKISFTAKDGSEAVIKGDEQAIEAIECAFERAGIKWNEQVETWDEGFYKRNSWENK